MALPIGPVGPRLAAALLVLLAFPAVLPAGDAPDARRHLDPLAAEVEEALESASDPRTRRALLSARDLLLSPGGGLEQDAARLRGASRLLEKRVKDRPALAAAAGSALRGLLDDADWEYASLSGAIDALDPGAALRTRAKVEASLAAARALAASSPSRGARSLLAAARVLGDLRLPPSPNYGGAFRVVSFAPPTGDLVGLNQEVVVVFSGPLDPRSVRPDTFQVRIGPNFQSQAPGSLVVSGNTVVFRPRLPVKPDRTDGGFPPGVKIRVTTVGYPSTNLILGKGRRPLDRSLTAEFTTAAAGGLLYDFTKFPDDPPPRLRETWPVDVLPSAPFDGPAGAAGVETAVLPVLRLARVPLDPATLPGRVRLLALDLRGRPTSLEVPGTAEVDQDDREVRLRFRPSATLADRSRYALRIEPGVMDLSGQFEMALHGGRSALHAAAAAEAAGEGGPLADLAAAHPEAVDPRTYLLFTTRDEPASDRQVVLRFDGTDRPVDGGDGSDPGRTTASYDAAVPGAVAAAIAAAGGDGSLGDLEPSASMTLDTAAASSEDGAFHYDRIRIPAGVTVTLAGPLPAILRARRGILVEGRLVASGAAGSNSEGAYNTATLTTQPGGAGGPGGGAGGTNSKDPAYGMPGGPGVSVPGGGFGGGGGYETSASDSQSFGGGGGGGGHATEGAAGGRGTWVPTTSSLNGQGGAGGSAGGSVPTSEATAGGTDFSGRAGGGGGAGGNNHYTVNGWRTSGAGGGGGGGALLLTSAGDIKVTGSLEARGGSGGSSHPSTGNYSGAPGGGGAGGTIALYSSGLVDVAGGTLDAGGGPGGIPLGWVGAGGAGGGGYVRLESASGEVAGIPAATLLPDYSTGTYDPESLEGDPPTVFTGAWFDLGAMEPEILPFGPEHFVEQGVPGCSIDYEIQMCGASPLDGGLPDTAALDPGTGDSTDPDRASPWVPLRSTAGGIQDPRPALNGRGWRFFRIRITFTLKGGLRAGDGLPFVEEVRIPFRVQGG